MSFQKQRSHNQSVLVSYVFFGVLRGWTKSIPKKAWHFGGFCKGSLFEIWPQCFGECIYIYSYGYPWRSAGQGRAFLLSQSWKLDPLQGSNKLPRGHVMPSVQVFLCNRSSCMFAIFSWIYILYTVSHYLCMCPCFLTCACIIAWLRYGIRSSLLTKSCANWDT